MNLSFALAYAAGCASMLVYSVMREHSQNKLFAWACSLIPLAIALVIWTAAG